MRSLISQIVSLMLWQVGAIKVSIDSPFKLVSGNYSPIYVDCRRVISSAPTMDMITAFFHWVWDEEKIMADVIAGGETAGIPFASYISQRLAKPMAYVRKRVKSHGTSSRIEGEITAGKKVVLVEDLITNGESKVDFIKPIREAGGIVNHCVVLFDRLQGGADVLSGEGVKLFSITNLNDALTYGVLHNRINHKEESDVREYLSNPKAWHTAKGLPFVN
ncbi:MAG: orotate phosphoribosyltransferase [Candidatus Brocadiales bacterium]